MSNEGKKEIQDLLDYINSKSKELEQKYDCDIIIADPIDKKSDKKCCLLYVDRERFLVGRIPNKEIMTGGVFTNPPPIGIKLVFGKQAMEIPVDEQETKIEFDGGGENEKGGITIRCRTKFLYTILKELFEKQDKLNGELIEGRKPA